MSNTKELLNALVPHLVVKFEWKNPEHTEINILESGHVQHGKTIRKILREHFVNYYPELLKKIEDYTGKEFVEAVKVTPPVIVQFLATELLTFEAYTDSILNAPKDAEIICNQTPEAEFVKTLFKSYEIWEEARANPVTPEVIIGGDTITIPRLSADDERVVTSVLKGFGVPEWNKLTGLINGAVIFQKQAIDLQEAFNKLVKDSTKEKDNLSKIISKLKDEFDSKLYSKMEVVGSGVIPNGKVEMRSVSDIFPGVTTKDFKVPYWVWDSKHPEVPEVDPHYIFREELLVRALYAIATNQRMYLQGHTGSGKTTLVEQIAAALNWPFMRINFDSEITRMDLIGRDTLKEGASVFVDGMLPKMMQSPYIGVFDEIDFCRPDVAYVMQSVLEGNSFRITEDGGRLVEPHPMFRMFATGNTVGQGDEHGMYQGARPQSLAFLDRFTIWGKVDYLAEAEREQLVKRHFPMLSDEAVKTINKYATEHLNAFETAKILQPISPRGILAVARAATFSLNSTKSVNKAIKEALTMSILDRCTASDYAVVKGIIDRVVK